MSDFFISNQLGLPGIGDDELVVHGTYVSPYPLDYIRLTFSVGLDFTREPVDIPFDSTDDKIAEAYEARVKGAYKWQQLCLPGVS